MGEKGKYEVPAVLRAIDIIEFIRKKGGAHFPEIYGELGIAKTSTYQILKTLESRGYIRYFGESKQYVLGLRLFELGNAAIARMDIRAEAIPILRDLMINTKQVCNLGVIEGLEGVYLAKIDSPQAIRIETWEGMRMPLHCTAMGKVLLAWRDENFIHKVFKSASVRQHGTERSIKDPKEFIKHLRIVREKGSALDDEEFQAHIRCVGVPVLDINNKVVAAISISGLNAEMDDRSVVRFSELAKSAAEELSQKLGATSRRSNGSFEIIG